MIIRDLEVPKGWKLVELKEILKNSQLGGNYENSESYDGLPLVKMGNVGRGKIKLNKIEKIPLKYKYAPDLLLSEGDLLFNTRNTLQLVGKVAIWKNELPKALYNSNLLRLEFDKDFVATNYFMNFVFNSNYGLRQLRSYATGTTSVGAIYTKDLFKLKILLPSIQEQKKISNILNTIDEKLEVIHQQILKTEELKKGLTQRLFTKGIGHTEFKDTQLGKVPKSWEAKRIGEIAKTFAGGTPKRNKPEYFSGGTIPWVKSGEVSSRFIDSTEEAVTETALKESSARQIPEDSLLIAMYGATAGQVGILKIPACSNQAVLAVVPSQNKFSIPFLYYYLSEATPDLLRMVQGSGQPNLSKRIVDSLLVPLPSKTEQMEIAQILDCISDKCGILSQKKKEYQQLKKVLMQQLLTGAIRVKTPIEGFL